MSQIDLIIFDCDGVLIDSELISSQCAASELQAVGMSITAEEVLPRSRRLQLARGTPFRPILSPDLWRGLRTRSRHSLSLSLEWPRC